MPTSANTTTHDSVDINSSELARFMDTVPESLQSKAFEHEGVVYIDNAGILLKALSYCGEHCKIYKPTYSIADFAFYKSTSLRSVVFPSSLRSIGSKAFWGCKNLCTYGFFQSNITSIGEEAFMNCKSIDSFSFPFLNNVRYLGRAAFSGMDKLQQIDLPEGLECIPEFCFGCDRELKQVNIPSTVKEVQESAFFDTGIEKIIFPDRVTLGPSLFTRSINLKTVILPKRLKAMPKRLFCMCYALEEIDIPADVEEIEERVFDSAKNLKVIRFHGKVPLICPTAFVGTDIHTVYIPWRYRRHYNQILKPLLPHCKIKYGGI